MSVGTQQTAQTMNVAGLFAYPCGAVICNLGVKDALIHIERSDSNRAYAGIIAGAMLVVLQVMHGKVLLQTVMQML